MNTDIIFFKDGELELKVNVSEERDTVWLDCQQIAELFGRDIKTIGKHINHVLKNELDNSTVAKNATIQKEGNRKVKREIEYYNFDMILTVGYWLIQSEVLLLENRRQVLLKITGFKDMPLIKRELKL